MSPSRCPLFGNVHKYTHNIILYLWGNFRLNREDLHHGVLHWVTWKSGMSFDSCDMCGTHKMAWEDWIGLLSGMFRVKINSALAST